MIVIDCPCENPPHTHEFPDDWVFGGPETTDPRADGRWESTTYHYYSADLIQVWVTQVPICDDMALDYFTNVAGWGPTMNPVMLIAVRPDGSKEMLPWTYDKTEDLLTPREEVSV